MGIQVGWKNRSRVSSRKDDSILRNYKKNTGLKLRFNIIPFAVREGLHENKITQIFTSIVFANLLKILVNCVIFAP